MTRFVPLIANTYFYGVNPGIRSIAVIQMSRPAAGLSLTGVTLLVSEARRRDSFRQLDDTISIEIEGDSFTATGRGYVELECDGIQFKMAVVDGRDARVSLETTEVDTYRTTDNKAGRGRWSFSFTVTGRFDDGYPDLLQVSIQGSFIENAGVFATKEL